MTPRRITLVTDELRGIRPVGGIGTVTTFLSLTLAKMGNQVEILHCGTPPTRTIDKDWEPVYAEAGIRIRFTPQHERQVEPRYFMGMRETEQALREDPPDVVITQDTAAPAYVALRLRKLGLAFDRTLFVVICHGTRLWIKDISRTVRVFPYLLGLSALEGASIEIADVVVSPSNYVIDWMQQQRWRLPRRTFVIPHLFGPLATEQRKPEPPPTQAVERIAFFGRLEERKGLRPFAAGINAVEPELLKRIELEFVGPPTDAWPTERVAALLTPPARDALRGISFATDLDQAAALERLSRRGTLVVMPSLGETFGNTVYECLARRIPFIASTAGATPELIAPEDHSRVLFEPTAAGVATALRCALSTNDALRPARPAFDVRRTQEQWAKVVATEPQAPHVSAERPRVAVVVVRRSSNGRCVPAVKRQTYEAVDPIVVEAAEYGSVAAARYAALGAATAPYVVFLDEDDEPRDDFVESLMRARTASDADVVTCGITLTDLSREHLFIGDPGGLGLLANSYGTGALIRRSFVADLGPPLAVEGDDDWLLLARLHLAGARIVSIPLPLLRSTRSPGSLERDPRDARLIVDAYERVLPDRFRSLARLAAGLAAAHQQTSRPRHLGIIRRATSRLRAELAG